MQNAIRNQETKESQKQHSLFGRRGTCAPGENRQLVVHTVSQQVVPFRIGTTAKV